MGTGQEVRLVLVPDTSARFQRDANALVSSGKGFWERGRTGGDLVSQAGTPFPSSLPFMLVISFAFCNSKAASEGGGCCGSSAYSLRAF